MLRLSLLQENHDEQYFGVEEEERAEEEEEEEEEEEDCVAASTVLIHRNTIRLGCSVLFDVYSPSCHFVSMPSYTLRAFPNTKLYHQVGNFPMVDGSTTLCATRMIGLVA